MLIYLDANIVQYYADFEIFIFGDDTTPPTSDIKLLKELKALQTLVELEQFGEGWEVAAPTHLIKELLKGQPTKDQQRIYGLLLRAWQDSEWQELVEANEEKIATIERSLRPLRLKDKSDRWHLAEAIALEASWFLTNDRNIIDRTRQNAEAVGNVQGVHVARPSEFIDDASTGLFLR
jgi:predicted nucleic acid-binding protein